MHFNLPQIRAFSWQLPALAVCPSCKSRTVHWSSPTWVRWGRISVLPITPSRSPGAQDEKPSLMPFA